MTEVAIALQSFWSSFEIPAYAENNIPDDATLPYITYSISQSDWKEPSSAYARVWYRSTRYTEIADKVDEISNAIGDGVSIKTNNGAVYLYKDMVFAQFQEYNNAEGQESDMKVAYLSMIQHALVK